MGHVMTAEFCTDDYEEAWAFNTARFRVSLAVKEEDEDPAVALAYTAHPRAHIKYARRGGWHWCETLVQVAYRDDVNARDWTIQRNLVLGEAYLGCCMYDDLANFKADGPLREMVCTAIQEARGKLVRMSARYRRTARSLGHVALA